MRKYLGTVNRALRALGVMVVPLPPSAKMLREHANISETHHPSGGGKTVKWLRDVADMRHGDTNG